MKRLITAYTSFNRTERMGIVALMAIILILIITKTTMHLWVKPDVNEAEQNALIAKWEAQQNTPRAASYATESTANNHRDATVTFTPKLFPFDPNTVTESQLQELGLQPKTISIFLNWRSKGKHFYKKEDFKPLYTLSQVEYERLAPYITIKVQRLNLNTADSASLVALPGIGAKLAHKILEYRKEIGSYTSVEQLKDVYHFPDSTIKLLKEQLTVN